MRLGAEARPTLTSRAYQEPHTVTVWGFLRFWAAQKQKSPPVVTGGAWSPERCWSRLEWGPAHRHVVPRVLGPESAELSACAGPRGGRPRGRGQWRWLRPDASA